MPGGKLYLASAWFLIALSSLALANIFTGQTWTGPASAACLLAFIITGCRIYGRRERLLITAGLGAASVALAIRDDAFALLVDTGERAAFLAAFMILLSMLREAASSSRSVLEIGSYLTRQPPGRRYVSLHAGSHLIGIVLNFGSLSLLGPLVQRGVRANAAEDGEALAHIRERRQISALFRGFSWVISWTPTAITQAIIPTVIIGAVQTRVALCGLGFAIAMFFLGWLEDKWRWRNIRAQLGLSEVRPDVPAAAFPRRAAVNFGLVCAVLAGLTVLFVMTSSAAVVMALMLAAPLVTVGWLIAQGSGPEGIGQTVRTRLNDLFSRAVPESSPETITLSAAGFAGIVAGQLAPADALTRLVDVTQLPHLALYALLVAIIPLASNISIPPIVTLTFFGTLLMGVPGLTADPTMLGVSFAAGWAINLTGSPFGASALVLSRATGIPGTVQIH